MHGFACYPPNHKTTKIPSVFKIILRMAISFDAIFVKPESIVTPISSGNGDAMINEAIIYKNVFLSQVLSPFSINLSINKKGLVFLILLNSPIKEIFITEKINISVIKEPTPPIKEAKKIFVSLTLNKNPTAKGDENPKE